MIADHGDAAEADLASTYQGVDADLRNLYRPGSGMTLRRLYVLLRGLPYDGLFKTEMRDAAEKAQIPQAEVIRARAARYAYLEDS